MAKVRSNILLISINANGLKVAIKEKRVFN